MCNTVCYKLIIDMCSKVITDWQTVCLQTVHTIVYVQSNCGLHSLMKHYLFPTTSVSALTTPSQSLHVPSCVLLVAQIANSIP